MIFLSARRVLSEGLKGRGYPLAGTLGELLSLAWVAVALAVFVPLWGIYGAAVALSSSYVVSLLLLLVLAARHGELESAGRVALLAASRSDPGRSERSGRPAEVALPGDRPPSPRLLVGSACDLVRAVAILCAGRCSRPSAGCGDGRGKGRPAVRAREHREPRIPPDHEQRHRGGWPVNALRRRPSLVASAPARRRAGGEAKLCGSHLDARRRSARSMSFQPRFSQPIDPKVETRGEPSDDGGDRANARVSSPTHAKRRQRSGTFQAHFYLVRNAAGWRLRAGSLPQLHRTAGGHSHPLRPCG